VVSTPISGCKNAGNGHREGGPTLIGEISDIEPVVVIDYSGRVQRAQIDYN
jgi:hypothetical protein